MSVGRSGVRLLLAGVALILATNAVVLGGVAYNRSGEPESTLALTERELRISHWNWPDNENSAIDLELSWRVPSVNEFHYYWGSEPDWLQEAQLRELGFDLSTPIADDEAARAYARQPSRRAFFVLEQAGPASQAAIDYARRRLERAAALAAANSADKQLQDELRSARDWMESEERTASQLFVIDAGVDATALRERYADRTRFAVVRGRVSVMVEGEPGQRRLVGRIEALDIQMIRVPHEYRAMVEPLVPRERQVPEAGPRFSATVSFGRRLEPWIAAFARLE